MMRRVYGCYFFEDGAGFIHIDFSRDKEPLMYAPGELGWSSYPDHSINWAKDLKTGVYYIPAKDGQFIQR